MKRKEEDGDLESGKGVGPGTDRYVQAYIAGALPSQQLRKGLALTRRALEPATSSKFEGCRRLHLLDFGGWGAVKFREVPTRDRRMLIAPIYKRDLHRRLLLELSEQSFNPALDFALFLDAADEALGRADSDEPPVGPS